MSLDKHEIETKINKEFLELCEKREIVNFLQIQKNYLSELKEEDSNLLVVAPTTSGKTLIAEMEILKKLFENNEQKNILYLAPMKSLIDERFQDFLDYEDFNVNVKYLPNLEKTDDNSKNIILSTPEQFFGYLSKDPLIATYLDLLIVDEIHMIGDSFRGKILETNITYIMTLNKKCKIIGLSATLTNYKDIADWINADVIISEKRSVPLEKFIILTNNRENEIRKIASKYIGKSGQMIIFKRNKREAEGLARKLVSQLGFLYNDEEYLELKTIFEENSSAEDNSSIDILLQDLFSKGVAFHHASLKNTQKRMIESSFRNGKLKCIVCTPTLSMGINLPSRIVIISEPQVGLNEMSVSLYNQISGRAGRLGFDDRGFSFLLSTSERKVKGLKRKYLESKSENVVSTLKALFKKEILESDFSQLLLQILSCGLFKDIDMIDEFFQNTFAGYEFQKEKGDKNKDFDGFFKIDKSSSVSKFRDTITKYLTWLISHNYLDKNEVYNLTDKGFLCINEFINPNIIESFIVEKDRILSKSNELEVLHLLCHFCLINRVSPTEVRNCIRRSLQLSREVGYDLLEACKRLNPNGTIDDLTMIEVASATFYSCVNEIPTGTISDNLKVYPGSLESEISKLSRYLTIFSKYSEIFSLEEEEIEILNVWGLRLRYGIKTKRVPFALIPNVGKAYSIGLSENYSSIEEFLNSDAEVISKIHAYDNPDHGEIGSNRAKSILNEALRIYGKKISMICSSCKVAIPILELSYSKRTKRLEARCKKCKYDLTLGTLGDIVPIKPLKLILDTSSLINKTISMYLAQNWLDRECIIQIPNEVVSELRVIEKDSKRNKLARDGLKELELITDFVKEGKILSWKKIGNELSFEELTKLKSSNPQFVDDLLIDLCREYDSILIIADETTARLGRLKGISVIWNTKIG